MTGASYTIARTIAFIGLGQMGLPMAKRLLQAGFAVNGVDPVAAAREALVAAGGTGFAAAPEAVAAADVVITMLPTGAIVQAVLTGPGGCAGALKPGTIVIDMSSSAPTDTLALADQLRAFGIALVDAPVSGGVRRAIDGSLAIMAGGAAADVEAVRPVLSAMGKTVFATGPCGSGHAMKALNNYVSAAGLVAACEALLVGRRFGLAPDTIVDVLNASTGRNNSTEVKMKPFVISEAFNSGFSLALMAKDLGIAAGLAEHLGIAAPELVFVTDLWQRAAAELPAGADHTAIYRFIAGEQARRDP
jgi:3-hydroxyisobutyrate dehydrogenase